MPSEIEPIDGDSSFAAMAPGREVAEAVVDESLKNDVYRAAAYGTCKRPSGGMLRGHDSSSSSSDSDDGDKKSSPLKSKVYGIFGREKPGGKPADVFLWRDKKISAGLLGGVTAIWLATALRIQINRAIVTLRDIASGRDLNRVNDNVVKEAYLCNCTLSKQKR
ncbi:hypothetical protein RJ640_004050 [Escallonia rubra]|uniref:Reticulon-like protein n=1 Tax=Escallonia rubra TaxID=112253 RepID=A0AA88UGR3_9ASTE|nr:hypothetical protein RJ640_004050 [Escallonia rubra]